MLKIQKIVAREILDSRGNPTVEAKVWLDDGSLGVAAVPSGASTGTHEALELRDGARKRYGGKGVLKAVKHVQTLIGPALFGKDASRQRDIDGVMLALDGTPHKKKLGANAMLSVSLAVCRAAAASRRTPLYQYIRDCFSLGIKGFRMPVPMMNVINGGRHADNNLTVQEFVLIPVQKEFSERVRMGSQMFHSLGAILREKGYSTNVGDEGGYAPELANNEQALQLLVAAIKASDLVPGKHVYLGMDLAASEFYHAGKYYFLSQKQASSADKLMSILERWTKKYPLISLEDPLAEDDWEAWSRLTKKFGRTVRVVGDDIFVTNTERIERGVAEGVANTVLIKPNQIGTLSETIDAIMLAKKHAYAVVISHRSGETADTFIADLSVAVNAEFIKTGSLSRSERVEKYNRLMDIEQELAHQER